VEQEVIDRIETALQAMPRVLFTNSYTGAGLSAVKVEMQGEYWGDRLPQVSDEGRHPADALR
jgi:multidrug efflux pump subunit AcrB